MFLGAVFVIEPDWSTGVARLLGIGRGADLVLYLLVLATSWGFLSMYMRLRAVRRDMTVLVRRIALDDADRDQRPETPDVSIRGAGIPEISQPRFAGNSQEGMVRSP